MLQNNWLAIIRSVRFAFKLEWKEGSKSRSSTLENRKGVEDFPYRGSAHFDIRGITRRAAAKSIIERANSRGWP